MFQVDAKYCPRHQGRCISAYDKEATDARRQGREPVVSDAERDRIRAERDAALDRVRAELAAELVAYVHGTHGQ
jgi:hypothetical protein